MARSAASSGVVAVGDLAGVGEPLEGLASSVRRRGEAAPTAARASGCRRAARCRSRARRSAASTCSVSRRLSIAASRCVAHSVRAARAGASRAQLLAGVVDHRPVGDRDPPARRDRRLLGAGGRAHRLAWSPPAAARARARARAGRRARSCAAAIRVASTVGGERLVDRDRVGLRVDRRGSGGRGSAGTGARTRPRSAPSARRVGGDRVRDPLALDQPHVPPVGGDDQPVGLDERDRQQRSRAIRPRPITTAPPRGRAAARPGRRSSSCELAGRLSSTSPCLSGARAARAAWASGGSGTIATR